MRTEITTSDGLQLAVWSDGPDDAPVLLCVHGYPDDHRVWDGVVDRLAGRFRVVRHDVRGAGESDTPSDRSGYLLPQLVSDIDAVIDWTGAGRVQLLAHDWGSVQSWAAVADPVVAARVASFTSISGPDISQLLVWIRRGLRSRHPREALGQALKSYYVGVFQLPRLPELAWRRGLLRRLLPASAGVPSTTDGVNGLELYRANLFGRPSTPKPVGVPTQVLAPERDRFVGVASQTGAPKPYVAELRTEVIPGEHWVVRAHPEVVVDRVLRWTAAHPV